jgi:tRNA 2-selenouridine synthase
LAKIQLIDAEVLAGEILAEPARFGAIIDVRSPAEFALDHAPGAISLPVLSNAERAEVGTIYVQDSRLRANRIGAAYVARNIARHLETALADKPADFAPLVYCWRGGQRSEAMATILSRVGWRTSLLVGGYKAYRAQVRQALYDAPWPAPVVLLDGDTGTGKTEILARLAARGCSVLDLEGLAEHRGSLLGGWAGRGQPSQKLFESRLWAARARLAPGRPVIVEAESSKIGDRMIPPGLWRAMQAAPRIEVVAPLDARARYLVGAYADLAADAPRLEAALACLPPHIGSANIKAWRARLDEGDILGFAEGIIAGHYDPAYARGRRQDRRAPIKVVAMASLAPADQEAAADAIAAVMNGMAASAP